MLKELAAADGESAGGNALRPFRKGGARGKRTRGVKDSLGKRSNGPTGKHLITRPRARHRDRNSGSTRFLGREEERDQAWRWAMGVAGVEMMGCYVSGRR